MEADGKDVLPMAAKELLPGKTADKTDGGEVIDYAHGRLVGWAAIRHKSKPDGSYWLLSGWTACDGSVCLTSVFYDDEADKQWAIEVFKSVNHVPSREDRIAKREPG